MKRSTFYSILYSTIAILGIGAAAYVQHQENKLVKKNCVGPIYTLATAQTGVGPVHSCVSTAGVAGPPLPLMD